MVTYFPAARYHVEPCAEHVPYDPIPALHSLNAPLEQLEAALDIAEVMGSDEWAHGPLMLLYMDSMHFTIPEWLSAHRDWSRANIWLKESLARKQAAGTLSGYDFLLRDPEMLTFLNGDENSRVER